MLKKWILLFKEESVPTERVAVLFHISYVKCYRFIIEAGVKLKLVHSCSEVTGMDDALVFPIKQSERYFSICPGEIIPKYLAFLSDRYALP